MLEGLNVVFNSKLPTRCEFRGRSPRSLAEQTQRTRKSRLAERAYEFRQRGRVLLPVAPHKSVADKPPGPTDDRNVFDDVLHQYPWLHQTTKPIENNKSTQPIHISEVVQDNDGLLTANRMKSFSAVKCYTNVPPPLCEERELSEHDIPSGGDDPVVEVAVAPEEGKK